MGKGFFSFRADPKAGECKHEVLHRSGLALIIYVSWFEGWVGLEYLGWMPENYFIKLMLVLSLPFSICEGILRSCLGAAVLACILITLACSSSWIVGGFVPTHETGIEVSVGGAIALSICMGSRCLLACILGLAVGPTGGFFWLKGYDWADNQFVEVWTFSGAIAILLVICVILPSGLAVWLGVKLSKRSQHNPPGTPAPPSV